MQTKLIGLAIITLFLSSCQSSSKLTSTANSAKKAYDIGDYLLATNLYAQTFDLYDKQLREIPDTMYVEAIESAQNARQSNFASQWIEAGALKYPNNTKLLVQQVELYKTSYRAADEYGIRKTNHEILAKSDTQNYERLFELAFQLEYFEDATQWFPHITSPTELQYDQELSALQKTSADEKTILNHCDKAIKNYPNLISAIDYKAVYLYTKAEDVYQKEMDYYNKNQNYTQWVLLRHELKKLSSNYRQARDLFIKLRKTDPDNKRYIRYLINCYVRLEMDKEAKALEKLDK